MVPWRGLCAGTAVVSSVAVLAVVASSALGEDATSRPSAKAAAAARPLIGKVVVIDPGHNGRNHRHPKVINRKVPAGPFKKACDTTGTSTNSGIKHLPGGVGGGPPSGDSERLPGGVGGGPPSGDSERLPGGVGGGPPSGDYAEHAYTFDVAVRLARTLRAQGATVHLTRPDDRGVGPCVDQRALAANRVRADAAISIHADGAPSTRRGFHVILPGLVKGYTGPIVAPSRRLGHDIRHAFRKGTGQPYANYIGRDGLDVRKDLGGLNMSKVPKVFIECGNMRNGTDAARMRDAAWRQRAATSLAAGLKTYVSR